MREYELNKTKEWNSIHFLSHSLIKSKAIDRGRNPREMIYHLTKLESPQK